MRTTANVRAWSSGRSCRLAFPRKTTLAPIDPFSAKRFVCIHLQTRCRHSLCAPAGVWSITLRGQGSDAIIPLPDVRLWVRRPGALPWPHFMSDAM
jgi:hypothetical protein